MESLGVSALRKRAHERGLEVDGSRQVLVKRLKTAEEDSVVPLEGSEMVQDETTTGVNLRISIFSTTITED